MTRPRELRAGLSQLDLHFGGRPGVIAAYLLQDGGEYALLEVGPASTLPALLAGLKGAGVQPEAISKLLVTHIHLDHAGAAGSLVRRYPHLQVYVHEVGAPHLEDPSKLLSSARRIYGDRMDELWGEVLPVPAANLVPLVDGTRVRIGRTTLAALYTPGHASHHVAFYDRARAELFTGDVAAIRLQGFDYIRPATPPPDVDLPAWNASLERLRAARAQRLYLTHFGEFTDVERHLTAAHRQLQEWADFIEGLLARGDDRDQMVTALAARAAEEVLAAQGDAGALEQYDLAAPTGMSVDGLVRYFRKRAPAPS